MAEVAERLNISVSAAKSRLYRARVELRDRLLRRSANGWRKEQAVKQQTLVAARGVKWMS